MELIGFSSYLVGTLAFLFLAILLWAGGHAKNQGIWLFTASLCTSVWFAALAMQARFGVFSVALISSLETLGMLVWLLLLKKLLLASTAAEDPLHRSIHNLQWVVIILVILLLTYAWTNEWIDRTFPDLLWVNTPFLGELILSVIGLVLIEQYYKNTRADKRSLIKYLCFALGGIFVYQFYLYSDALLFERISADIWQARGIVISLLAPLIVVAAKRNNDWAPDIFVSRGVVFHSVTLLVAGIYLLVMAAVGDFIRHFGGDWGPILQIVFLVSAFIILVVLLFSGRIRAKLRVFLSKNFFNYAFDYRGEWLKIIELFSDQTESASVEKKIIVSLSRLVSSSSGALWVKDDENVFRWRCSYGDFEIEHQSIPADEPLITFICDQGWIVNIDELGTSPDLYDGLQLPEWIHSSMKLWLITPLFHAESLVGLVFLGKPNVSIEVNWEVRDLLKTSGSQAAGYLALEEAARQLAEARQFEGFNRLSAFVIHDLKNLIAQLSLVVRNAEKHADNPLFMKDAIKTVDHAVDKMQRLMSQLKNTTAGVNKENIDLIGVLTEVIESRAKQAPVPRLELIGQDLCVSAVKDRLASAFEHVIQNAQDAAGKGGDVVVLLKEENNKVVIDVTDNGCGMSEDFIRNRLFKPFETTKGLTGMGIGAYESREYIRSIGGDLLVDSQSGVGSCFHFILPIGLWSLSGRELS